MSVAGLLAATALSACASLPTPTPPRVAKTPQSYATAQSLAAPTRDWPTDAWWTAYGDTQLDGLMQEALAGAPDLAAAQARVRKAQALTATARSALLRIARSFLTHVINETTVRNFRLIVAEAERTPEIGRSFYDAGPRRGGERLAEFLASLEAAGVLDLEGDPLGAAQHFLGLVQSPTFKGRLCNAIPELTDRQIDEEAARGVRAFLRAYGPRT